MRQASKVLSPQPYSQLLVLSDRNNDAPGPWEDKGLQFGTVLRIGLSRKLIGALTQ
jgi:hypothetical protein